MRGLISVCFFMCLESTFMLSSVAQNRTLLTREAIDSLVKPPLLDGAEKLLSFENNQLSVGVMAETDEPKTIHYWFHNVGDEPILLTRVRTNCGCTLANFEKKPIPVGARSSISLTYNPKNRPGTVDINAYVYSTHSSKQPIARLTLLGEVVANDDGWTHLPYSMGLLRLKQNRLVFHDVARNAQVVERVLCGNSGQTPLKLTAKMLPSYASFRTEPEIIEPGMEGDIVVTVDGTRLPESCNDELEFVVLLEGINVKPSERILKVVVKVE